MELILQSFESVDDFSDFRADQGRLLDYIVSWGNLTEEKVASYLQSVLEALHYLHNCRIVHLDVKVSFLADLVTLLNILVYPSLMNVSSLPHVATIKT